MQSRNRWRKLSISLWSVQALFHRRPRKVYAAVRRILRLGGWPPLHSAEAWKMVDDKLYLNYNKAVQAKWIAEAGNLIAAGDAN